MINSDNLATKPLHIIADENTYQVEKYFSKVGKVTLLPAPQITAQTLKKADILLTRSKNQINQNLLANTPVKFIGSTVSGTEHIDFSYVTKNNIYLSIAKGCNANSVANYCLLAILQTLKATQQKITLENQQIGTIGYGATAQKFIDKLGILGASILCYDPPYFQKDKKTITAKHQPYTNSTDNLADIMRCNIISLHPALHTNAPYPSHQLINKKHIQQLNPETIFLNTSRGEIIDENALLEHLSHTQNKLNLIIDCWQNEPDINQQLRQHTYIATPHIAGHSIQAKQQGTLHCYKDLLTWIAQENPSAQIPSLISSSLSQETPIKIDLAHCQTKEEIILAIHQHYYLPSRDNLSQELHPQQRSQQFTDYRKNYPPRHEPSPHNLHLQNTPTHLQDFTNHIANIL
jgi:erythronate-4-phosphate dehydrogenase